MTDVKPRRVSESGWVVEDCVDSASVARWLAGVPGVVEAWPAFDCVAVEGDLDLLAALDGFRTHASSGLCVVHEIPVRYDGPDLARVAEICGLTVAEVVRLHTGSEYRVGAMGFSPGFGYLTGLAPKLAGVPRLASPRARVNQGSVAVAEEYCAVYPSDSPGGWNLIGATDLVMADLASSWFRLKVGDKVVFRCTGMA